MRLVHFLGVALLAVSGLSFAQVEADLRIHGSDTLGRELAPALVKEWLQQQGYGKISEEQKGAERLLSGVDGSGKALTVQLEARGSSTGFTALQREQAHIAMSSRRIKAGEVAALKKYGRCDSAACEYVVALDGIAVIVNPANPLAELDRETLQRIFSGEISNWSQVGGKAGPIHLHALDENSGTYDTFMFLVMGKAKLAAGAKRDAAHEAIAQMVAKDPAAIGFVGLPFARNSKALAITDGGAHTEAPEPFNVATEDYALARRLYFYAPEMSAPPLAKAFVEFAVSDAGQKVVERIGFVSQMVMAGDDIHDHGPEDYIALTSGAKRLSLNFRFVPGTPTLDIKAQQDLERLKQYLSERGERKELMLFGFSDSNEAMPIVSLQLSTDRADVVADLLVKQGVRPGKVRGFGSELPVASNENDIGRNRNRRVEVWVR
jgi:phosphate transport system substrate-binding protein